MKKGIIGLIVCSMMTFGCKDEDPNKVGTLLSGNLKVAFDETLQPIADAEMDVFNHNYPEAKVEITYKSEIESVQNLMDDSVRLIFIGRKLNTKEATYFESINLRPVQTKICTDAIALIVNASNKDVQITYDKIIKVLKGEITNWSQLGGKQTGDINLVFDRQGSGTVNYVLRETGMTTLPKNAYAKKSIKEAIEYVATTENSIGIIGWSWLSDEEDPITKDYLKKVNVVSLSPKSDTIAKGFFKPYPADLEANRYPLTREVYVIQRGAINGLARGFAAFVEGDIGQKIILKAGLYPVYQTERLIQFKETPMKLK
jgi:phosphate transport system substrate-binding protein